MASKVDREAYRNTMEELAQFRQDLGIHALPSDFKVVDEGTSGPGRPPNTLMPVYNTIDLGITQGRFERVLFNLASLTGFFPPGYKK